MGLPSTWASKTCAPWPVLHSQGRHRSPRSHRKSPCGCGGGQREGRKRQACGGEGGELKSAISQTEHHPHHRSRRQQDRLCEANSEQEDGETPLESGKKPDVRTTSFFLKYNKLVSLDGWLETVETLLPGRKWEALVWVDLSHNRLTSIGK